MKLTKLLKFFGLGMLFVSLTTCGKKKSNDEEQNSLNLADEEDSAADHLLSFRSVTEINEILRSRVVTENDFDIISCLIQFQESIFNGLLGSPLKKEVGGLMGSYQGLGLRVATESMRPSTVHALLWGLTIQDFAREVGKSCSEKSTKFTLRPDVDVVVKNLCSSDELKEQDLKALWNLLLRKDVNESEFADWWATEKDALSQVKGSARVTMAVHEMLFGPEFLIGR